MGKRYSAVFGVPQDTWNIFMEKISYSRGIPIVGMIFVFHISFKFLLAFFSWYDAIRYVLWGKYRLEGLMVNYYNEIWIYKFLNSGS